MPSLATTVSKIPFSMTTVPSACNVRQQLSYPNSITAWLNEFDALYTKHSTHLDSDRDWSQRVCVFDRR